MKISTLQRSVSLESPTQDPEIYRNRTEGNFLRISPLHIIV